MSTSCIGSEGGSFAGSLDPDSCTVVPTPTEVVNKAGVAGNFWTVSFTVKGEDKEDEEVFMHVKPHCIHTSSGMLRFHLERQHGFADFTKALRERGLLKPDCKLDAAAEDLYESATVFVHYPKESDVYKFGNDPFTRVACFFMLTIWLNSPFKTDAEFLAAMRDYFKSLHAPASSVVPTTPAQQKVDNSKMGVSPSQEQEPPLFDAGLPPSKLAHSPTTAEADLLFASLKELSANVQAMSQIQQRQMLFSAKESKQASQSTASTVKDFNDRIKLKEKSNGLAAMLEFIGYCQKELGSPDSIVADDKPNPAYISTQDSTPNSDGNFSQSTLSVQNVSLRLVIEDLDKKLTDSDHPAQIGGNSLLFSGSKLKDTLKELERRKNLDTEKDRCKKLVLFAISKINDTEDQTKQAAFDLLFLVLFYASAKLKGITDENPHGLDVEFARCVKKASTLSASLPYETDSDAKSDSKSSVQSDDSARKLAAAQREADKKEKEYQKLLAQLQQEKNRVANLEGENKGLREGQPSTTRAARQPNQKKDPVVPAPPAAPAASPPASAPPTGDQKHE